MQTDLPTLSMEKWIKAGQPHVQKKLSEYTIEFLKNLPHPKTMRN